MRNLLAGLAVLFVSVSGFSHDEPLSGVMKKIGQEFFFISKQVADPAQNENTLERTGTLLALAGQALPLTPPKVDALEGQERIEAKIVCERFISRLVSAVLDLRESVAASNNPAAVDNVKALLALRNEAHGVCKE